MGKQDGSIRSFFAKAPSQPEAMPSSQELPSSQKTPPRSRHDEIRGSDDDDEDNDSDGSIESLSAIFGAPKNPPSPRNRDPGLTATPRAKRIASGGSAHLSPLTLQQKQSQRHKYDLKALLRDSAQDKKAAASYKRAKDLFNQKEDGIEDPDSASPENGSSDDEDDATRTTGDKLNGLKKKALGFLDNNEGGKGDRLARAIDRSKTKSSQKRCYFFGPSSPQLYSLQKRPNFPYDKATGRWEFMADPSSRDQAIIHGLAHTTLTKGRELPDEIFVWILEEVCLERNAQLRLKYCSLISRCPSKTTRLVNEARLCAALRSIGGAVPSDRQRSGKFETSAELEEPYQGRDWSGLVTFLHLVKAIAPNLTRASAVCAIKLLLRMSLDPIVKTIVCAEHASALESLVSSVRKSEASWDNTVCRNAFFQQLRT